MHDSMHYAQWKRGSQVIRASVHPVARSAATWVVFCHGFTGHRLGPGYLFVKISWALAAGGTGSLRFDFCGSGESDGRFCDMTLSTMVADLLSAVDYVRSTYGAGHVVAFGHSLGAAVAALGAVKARLDGLILVAPVADPQGLLERRKETVLRAGLNERGFYENGPHEMSMAFVEDLKRKRPLDALSGYRGSLIVFQGDADASVGVEEASCYVRRAADAGAVDAEIHVLRGSDHNFSSVSAVSYICATISRWVEERFA